jgi:hypothetical protein
VNRYSNPITVSIHNNLWFYINFLSGLLYQFTTTYVSTFLFIRITVSIHCIDSQQFMFLHYFFQDYCIDSQQFMFLHYFLSRLLYRFTTINVSTLLFIRITVSIHNNWCFYISFYQDYCIDSIRIKRNVET